MGKAVALNGRCVPLVAVNPEAAIVAFVRRRSGNGRLAVGEARKALSGRHVLLVPIRRPDLRP